MKSFFTQLIAKYLAIWARFVIAERRPRIIGVTGSVGKTTTKDAITCVLESSAARPLIGLVGKSMGNLNTEIGLPLAILRYNHAPLSILGWLWCLFLLPARTFFLTTIARYPSILVLEYGADRPGDLVRLLAIAKPEIAVVTAVGPAHLEQFSTIEMVAKEKSQLVRHLPLTGLAILAKDNAWVYAMERETHAPVRFVAGRGLVLARAVAVQIGRYLGLTTADIQAALLTCLSSPGRLQIEQLDTTLLIDDTYNANPLSMELAFDTLVEQAKPRQRRIAFLGQMNELGTSATFHHEAVGRLAHQAVDLLIGVGPLARSYQADAWYASAADCATVVDQWLRPGDAILVKGSRGIQMEKVVTAIRKLLDQPKLSEKSRPTSNKRVRS